MPVVARVPWDTPWGTGVLTDGLGGSWTRVSYRVGLQVVVAEPVGGGQEFQRNVLGEQPYPLFLEAVEGPASPGEQAEQDVRGVDVHAGGGARPR